LKFEAHYLQFKKIDSFRKRFDTKYRQGSPLVMSLLPPFSSDKRYLSDRLVYEMEDEIDSHLIGISNTSEIQFNGIDVINAKKSLLCLRPEMPDEFYYIEQAISELLKDYKIKFKKSIIAKEVDGNHQALLPLGRFKDPREFTEALNQAKLEFNSPFKLKIKDISLYAKVEDTWVQKHKLYEFDNKIIEDQRNFQITI
jgi:hypothetical protein